MRHRTLSLTGGFAYLCDRDTAETRAVSVDDVGRGEE